jgi:hypothetical protein
MPAWRVRRYHDGSPFIFASDRSSRGPAAERLENEATEPFIRQRMAARIQPLDRLIRVEWGTNLLALLAARVLMP